MWKNGIVRSTVGASATTALVATMMFSGGGFNPAVASPLDKQDTGVEQQLLNAVDGSSVTVDSGAKKSEAPADAATTDGVSSPKVDAPVVEAPKAPAEKKPAAPAKAVEPKKQEAAKPTAPVNKNVTDDNSAAPLADESADAPVLDRPMTTSQSRVALAAADPVIKNPALPQKCGLKIAIVLDLSNSLVGEDVPNSKKAAKGMVDALQGTPSSVGLFTFATFAPDKTNSSLSATSVSSKSGADKVKKAIDDLERVPSSVGGTNWDRGLGQVPTGVYDMILFVTDGNPTAYGTPGSSPNLDYGFNADAIDLEKAITAANSHKKAGTFVMGLGVGASINSDNIKKISGNTKDQDYFIISDYSKLAAKLKEIALKNCKGTVTVVKQVRGLDGSLEASNGWRISSSTELISPESAITAADGTANFTVGGLDKETSRIVTFSEEQKSGYELETQNDKNAVCVDNSSDQKLNVTNSGDLGFNVNVERGAAVSCTIINAEKSASLQVNKTWIINGKAATSAEAAAIGASAAPKLTPVPKSGQPSFGEVVDGYKVGASVNINETFVPGDRCVPGKQSIKFGAGATSSLAKTGFDAKLELGENIATITNELSCDATLTLVKKVDNKGSEGASATDWKLSAINSGGNTNLENVVTGTTKNVVPGTYKLSEANGPTGYDLTDLTCVSGSNPISGIDLEKPNVTLKTGDNVTCTFTNSRVEYKDLSVSKTVDVTFDRDYDWSIDKKVDATQKKVNSATGDVDFNYTVDVSAGEPIDTNFKASGNITLTNPNSIAIKGVALTDQLEGATCVIKDAQGKTVTDSITVPSGGSNFSYTCEMPKETSATSAGTNTVTATWTKVDYFGTSGTAKGDATYDFSKVTPTVTDASITVTDDKFDLTTIEGGNAVSVDQSPKSFTYTKSWPGVAGECTDYNNKATFEEADSKRTDSDAEKVTLCIGAPLSIDKNVVSSFDRSYLWDITKTAKGESPYTAEPETGKVTVGYDVTVKPKDPAFTDSKWAMSGVITVSNPNKWQDITATISDSVDAGEGAVCTVTGIVGGGADADLDTEGFQGVIPAEKSVQFNYGCEFAKEPSYTGTNTATATWDAATASTTGNSVEKTVEFEESSWAQKPLNKTITVTDPEHDFTPDWNITWSKEMAPQTKSYEVTWTVDEAGTCKNFENTATFLGSEGLTGSSTANIEACRDAALSVTKTVDASFDRTYLWGIDKSLAKGQDSKVNTGDSGEAKVNYDITVSSKGYKDSNQQVSGNITVTNSNRFGGDTEVTVADKTTIEGMVCTVDAQADTNPELAGIQVNVPQATEAAGKWSNGTKTVAYNCDASKITEGDYTGNTNTASISWNDGKNTATSKAVAIDFTLAKATDETVEVFDNQAITDGAGKLVGAVSWDEIKDKDPRSKTFPYSLTHAVESGTCAPFTNTAWVELAGDVENPTDSADVTLCNQIGLGVAKTANASFDREYFWSIEKSVDKNHVEIPDGFATFNYIVAVTPLTYEDSNHKLTGTITLTNPNTFADGAITATVEDNVGIDGLVCTIDNADELDVDKTLDGLQVLVPAATEGIAGTVALPYSCDGTPAESDYKGKNTVNVSWTGAAGNGTASVEEPFTYLEVSSKNKTIEVFDDKVNQSESPVKLGDATWSNTGKAQPFEYALSFAGTPGVCTDYTNTATIKGTELSDSETVTVCVEKGLVVSKDANASYDRDYDWKIEKKVDKTSFNVDGDGKVKANYTVTATQNGHTDSGWTLGGNITVHNPNTFGSISADISDSLNVEGITCSVTDGKDVKIAAGKTVELAYTCDVADGVDETKYTGFLKNTATATWGEDRSASSEPVAVDFTLDKKTDATVDVFDDKTDPQAEPVKLGTATLGGENIFTYAQELAGVAGKCTTFTNTAVVEEKLGSDADNSASAAVEVCVEAGLTVVKTVDAKFTRDYNWKIAKEAKKTSFTADENGKVEAEYKITAALDGHKDQDWTMSGAIDVFNPNTQGEMKVNISDAAQIPGAVCTVAGGGTDVTVPAASKVDENIILGKATVAYDCELTEPVEPANYTGKKNTATVSWIGVDGEKRDISVEADIEFKQTRSIDETVTIVDDQTVEGTELVLGTVTPDESPKDFSTSVSLQGTSGKCTTFTNTAVVQETTGSDANNTANADVEVCGKAGLGINKTANASFDREYLWSLAKQANDPTSVEIGLDGEATFDYLVAAKPEGYKDTNHSLTGEITLTNANEFEGGAITATVTDVVDIKGLTCKIAAKDIDEKAPGLQVVVPAASVGDKALVLPYSCTGVPANEDYEGTNTATASWKNVAGVEVSAIKTVDVKYEQKSSKNHEVDVFDDKAGTVEKPVLLGKAIWNAEGKTTDFPYSLTFKNDNELATDGTCVDHVNTATIPAADKKATETVSVCVKVGAPTVEKTVTGTSQNADGTWSITYDVVVTGDDLLKGRYSLEDTLRFGEGITVNSAAWTGPVAGDGDSWDLAAKNLTEVLATDKLIEAKGIDTYKVTVNASVAAGVTGSAAANCELTKGEEGTGFLNSATITANGEKTNAEACATPSIPTVAKTFVSAVQQDDASWIVKYSLVVDNSAGKDGFYDLSDTPDFAAGIVINGRSVTAPEGITVVEDQPNGQIVENQAITAGATHTYGVEFAVNVPVTGIPEGDLSCEPGVPGKGFFNKATLSSGNDDVVSEACGPVEEGGVPSITKDVTGTEQLADGSWNVTYEVRVKANADFATKYDLVDELKFGAGIKINSASWTGLTNGNFVDGKAQMAKDKVLAKGAEDDIYTVTVNATVPTKVIGAEAGNCELTEGEKGTGFLNSATISNGAWNTSASDCATPTEMKISKEAASAVTQQADGSWNVSYLLSVDNTDGHAGIYSLIDTPAFAPNVTINSWSATNVEGTPELEKSGTATSVTLIENGKIEANAKHQYNVVFNVAISVKDSDKAQVCEDGKPSNGFFNEATLNIGGEPAKDADCVDIPALDKPTIAKTATGSNQNDDGSWTVTYDVVVTGSETQRITYTVDDTLKFGEGITVTGASWTGPVNGTWNNLPTDLTETLGRDQILEAGAEPHVYSVSVTANVAAGVIAAPAGNCELDKGEEGTGFLNATALSVDGVQVDEATACAEPASPTFTKDPVELTANEDGTFNAVYKLVVSNNATNGQNVSYTLNDAPVLPSGIDLLEGSVTTDVKDANANWNGTTDTLVAENQILTAGVQHIYTVSLKVKISSPINEADRTCEAGGGLLNTGELSSGADNFIDDACLEIPAPKINIAKTAGEPVETSVGNWAISYTVTVTNETVVPASYDLTDTLRFGEGIDPQTASWVLEGTETKGSWDPTESKTGVLATGTELGSLGKHVYTVSVNTKVAPASVGTAAGVCEATGESTDRAFLNETTVKTDSQQESAEDCAQPHVNVASLSVTKKITGETAGFIGGDAKAFEVSWTCEAPNGQLIKGEGIKIAQGAEATLLSEEIPVGSVCSVTEEDPSKALLEDASYVWGTPSYSPKTVTPTIDQRLVSIEVTNPIERDLGAVEVKKSVASVKQLESGKWAISYDVVVTNPADAQSIYTLKDKLRFGKGLDIVSAQYRAAGSDWTTWEDTSAEAVLANDRVIERSRPDAPKSVHQYQVEVIADVAAGTIGSAAGTCDAENENAGGGFLNEATVNVGDQEATDIACATPSIPTVAKSFVSAVQQDDASWIVKYSLVVDNSAGKDGFYDLSDTPDFATGIVINGRTVTAPEGITLAEDQTDGTIVAGQAIKAGEIHTYGVEFAVTVPVIGIPVDELSCEAGESGKGFFNTATLSSGNDDVVTEACGPVEEGGVPSITKDVIGTEQLADGSWNVTYAVHVESNKDFATTYDLVDELKFGAGIKINSASWTGLSNGDFVDGKAKMARGQVIAKGAADDIYTVTVNATVPTKVIGTEAGNCELIEGEKGTGFLNSATISGEGWNKRDDACATPTEMKISKDAISDAVQQENGSWNVAYLLNVDNTDGHAGLYSLSDIPAFSKGVSINNWSVQAADEDTPSIDLVEQAYADGVIRTDQDIDANAKHSYRVTFNVEVALADSIENATCGAEGGEAGNGFFNTAELAVGNDKTEDSDCVEVPKVGAPTVEKTATGTNQDADGNWVVSYQIQVKATGENTSKYTLEDTLAYGDGATILEAAWAGPGEGESGTWENPNERRTAALATDRLIKPGTTDIYTVNVVASVAKGATGTPSMDCKIGEGEDGKTGFLNTVKLGNAGTTIGTDDACSTPAAPIFDKQAGELVQHEDAEGNWDGTWDASYTLRVTNPATEGQQVNYELSDTPAFAKGVIVNDRNVSSDDVAVNEGWHGKDSTDDVIISGQVLDAGATHNFNVIINVSLTADINDADRVCAAEGTEGGNGLLNTGTVNSGNESSTDDACLEIPAPSSNVVKTAVSSEENADGSWDIHYTVVVNNTSDVAARYDLADTLRFGAGITATNANWSLEGTEEAGNWENPGTEPSTVLVKGRDLEARDSHTYLVHVVANLEDGVIGSEAGTCQTEDSETNGGFLNEATLVANGKTSASRDCLAPEKNPRGYSMVKTADPSNGTVMWPGEDINYTITVRNTGEFVYPDAVVTDEMAGWQQAATLKEGSLKLSGGESVIEGSKLIWTVGELEVGESKTLTYTITVNDEAWDQMLVNVATGSGDVPPSKTTHPTPEYHKLPEPPVVIVPPVVPTPEPVLPGTETKVPPRKPVPPLASTGASNATLWIVGSGALVLLLGTGFMMVARRRKSEQN